MKKLLLILLCLPLLFYAQHSDRVLEIKRMYKATKSYEKKGDCKTRSNINLATPNGNEKATKCIYPYSYSRISFWQDQCNSSYNAEYYFKNGNLYFAYSDWWDANDRGVEITRVYFKENGGIEKVLIDVGDGNTQVTDRSSIERIKESVIQRLNFAEKELLNRK